MTTLTRPLRAPDTRADAPPRTRARRHLLTANDILVLIAASGVLVTGIWVRHGGLDQLGTIPGALTGIGQITALLGTWVALVGVLLMARVPWIDHVVGLRPTPRLAPLDRLRDALAADRAMPCSRPPAGSPAPARTSSATRSRSGPHGTCCSPSWAWAC